MYQIYTLVDPRNKQVRYVGLTINTQQRFINHINLSDQYNQEKREWIRELKGLNLLPMMKIIDSVETKYEAEKREAYWIQHYLDLHLPLLNISKNTTIEIAPPPTPLTNQLLAESQIKDILFTVDLLRQVLHENGWNLFIRKRREQEYFYAQKWLRKEVYLTSINRLHSLKLEHVLEKIAQA